jgi:hypothetical protein
MAAHRAFYVTQGSLAVWSDGGSDGSSAHVFADNDAGLREFDAYLAESSEQTSFVVIDVIEEEFAPDTIPKLGLRDRGALMRRRMQRKFPRTAYRLPLYQGPNEKGADEAVVVHSAITNHELLDPWLQMILGHEVPLTGIYSVPLMAPQLLSLLHKVTGPAMLLTQHQERKLRQVFMQGGHVKSARLSQSPAITDDQYPQFVLTEIGRSRRYLERTRLLSSMEQLDVYVVAHASLAERILSEAKSDSPLKIHFVKPDVAAQRVGLRTEAQPDHLEALYLAMSCRRRPKRNYAVSGETRFWQMRRMRHAVIGSAVAAAAVCSFLTGLYLSDGWLLQKRATDIEQQLTQLTETFRRENEEFNPIKADSHEMQLTVDTGDFILANRLPVPWVMQQVGLVMGDYGDIQILNLGWSAESAIAEAPARQRRGEQPLPVPVPAIAAINANITADITSFDGNMRGAFARIDALVSDLQARTAFSDVAVIEYPLDARPQSSLSGEIAGGANTETARFQLRLRFPVPTSAAGAAEANDESV